MQGAFDLHLQIESNLPEMVGAFHSISSAQQQDVQDFVHIAVHLVQDVVRTAGGGLKKKSFHAGQISQRAHWLIWQPISLYLTISMMVRKKSS